MRTVAVRRWTSPPADRGATVVEFTLVTAVLVAVLFTVIDAGRVFMADQDVATASREGARYALGGSHYGDCAGIRTAATVLAARSGITGVDVTIQYDTGPGSAVVATCPTGVALTPGSRVVVTVSRTVPLVGPLFRPVTVRATTRRTLLRGSG
jgi:Flp pilus assembly protein TadG